MTPTNQGSFKLFRIAGIDIFLHWSWFVVAAYEISSRGKEYTSLTWNILEYVALFVIVLMHELGHSLACRQTGGIANRIVLWPLGGVAYVQPPPRPGATLWSIAAGPLVNALLLPILIGILFTMRSTGLAQTMPDAYGLAKAVTVINVVLLVFNILPVYPLDGGQILQSLLWFIFGRARSLVIATIIGFVGVAALGVLAFLIQSVWTGIVCVFILLNCWQGFQYGLSLLKLSKVPRHTGFACPACQAAPPAGAFWKCGKCMQPFDTFETAATCPDCGTIFEDTQCIDCGTRNPVSAWQRVQSTPPPLTTESSPWYGSGTPPDGSGQK